MRPLARKAARNYVDRLWADEEGLVEAIVADGWPEAMVRAGLAMHRESWDVEAMAAAVEDELQMVRRSERHRLVWPGSVHHIWPALPGAGMAPVLVGMLLGVEQAVRPSRRALNFARRAARDAPWRLMEPDADWADAELVVASGSDETVASVRREMSGRGRVIGYGHRSSVAVVVDGPDVDPGAAAADVAADVVMWHQRGCFSVRAVLFCGGSDRRRVFCEQLAAKIADCEQRWDGADVGDAELAARAQALGIAELQGPVWCRGVGYVREEEQPFSDNREAIHSVTVHPIEGPEAVESMIDVSTTGIQGVAMAGDWRSNRQQWQKALGRIGATRIAPAGTLQSPPAHWWHDGRANALSWARVVSV